MLNGMAFLVRHAFGFRTYLTVLRIIEEPSPPTRMSRDDVLKAANSAAIKAGYTLTEYGAPEAHYEFVRKDKRWTVFYNMKPPTPAGGHFHVWVEDQTGKTQVMRGE